MGNTKIIQRIQYNYRHVNFFCKHKPIALNSYSAVERRKCEIFLLSMFICEIYAGISNLRSRKLSSLYSQLFLLLLLLPCDEPAVWCTGWHSNVIRRHTHRHPSNTPITHPSPGCVISVQTKLTHTCTLHVNSNSTLVTVTTTLTCVLKIHFHKEQSTSSMIFFYLQDTTDNWQTTILLR